MAETNLEIAVVVRSESFGSVWASLAEPLGVGLRTVGAPAELGSGARLGAVIVAAGGVEGEAVELVGILRATVGAEAVVVGASTDHRLATALVRAGASDYFALPADLEPLRAWLAERVERVRSAARAAKLAVEVRATYDFSRMIGRSAALRTALDRAARIIPHGTASVLLTGETGTGKELLARAIHYNSPRRAGPFVEINCTAIPATLLESELFGYEAGAFTDARSAKPGLFEAAHGGTLLLDEIGDLTPDLQAKLLKVLEEKQVRRLGGLRAVGMDVRVIAATHVDLLRAEREGRFRRDLYYRLNVVPIHLPPLRERGEDVILLADSFLDEFAREYGLERPALTAQTRAALLAYSWPGNVRELRNALERALLLGGGRLDPADLIQQPVEPAASPLPFPATLAEIEEAAARATLERLGGNKSAAAEVLGISRSRLYRLLERPDAPSTEA